MEWLTPELIERHGISVIAFMVMAFLFWRQQNIQKDRDKMESERVKVRDETIEKARQSETDQQNKILDMYNRFDSTLAILNDTLKTAFATIHDDKQNTSKALEANTDNLKAHTVGINQLTEKIGTFETTMTEHMQNRPTLLELLEQIKAGIETLDRKISNVETEVKGVREEFNTIKAQTKQVEKSVTSEAQVIEVTVEPSETDKKQTGKSNLANRSSTDES